MLPITLRPLADVAALGAVVICGSMARSECAESKDGLGYFWEHAAALRSPASTAGAFFAVRRVSEVAQLATNDVDLDSEKGAVNNRVARQKDDQIGASQLAFLVAIPAWVDVCPVHTIAEWPWFLEWLKRGKGRNGRTAVGSVGIRSSRV